MRLCMFHPEDLPLERGWVGRIDGDHVVQLAAQTLESFFTGGGSAREHAVYRLAAVHLLAPVLHPPSVRVFEDESTFAFANPAAIVGPGARIRGDAGHGRLQVLPRVACVVGADEAIAGFTALAEWRWSGVAPPKDRDFALGLGPVVVTLDELGSAPLAAVVRMNDDVLAEATFDGFAWEAARALAASGTVLRPGDLLAGPALDAVPVGPDGGVAVEIGGVGTLAQSVGS